MGISQVSIHKIKCFYFSLTFFSLFFSKSRHLLAWGFLSYNYKVLRSWIICTWKSSNFLHSQGSKLTKHTNWMLITNINLRIFFYHYITTKFKSSGLVAPCQQINLDVHFKINIVLYFTKSISLVLINISIFALI